MAHGFWVHLKDDIAREWVGVVGDAMLPVQSPFPQPANLPGFGVAQRVFLLAMDQLPAEVIDRIAQKLADKFDLSLEQAREEVRAAGIPIREEHVLAVIIHSPQHWLV